jgi:hypothetical protein
MHQLFLDSGDHDRAANTGQVVGALDAEDMRVAGRQRVQMPALELGAVIDGNVEQLGLVGVADIAGIGSSGRSRSAVGGAPDPADDPPETT